MKRSITIVLIGLGLTGAACSSSTSATPSSGQVSTSAAAMIARINPAIAKAGTAHFTDTTKIGGQTEVIVGSAGPDTADETLLVNNKLTLQILKVNATLYLKDSSATALEAVLGISKAVAPKYAGSWISVSPSDKTYASLSKATTLASELHAFIPNPKGASLSANGPTTMLRQQAVVSGSNKRTASLTVVSASALPVSGLISVSGTAGSETKRVTVSKWGKAVSPRVPTKSVALHSLLG
jgi:uncharacterized protein with beta-barrel porin domain